MYCINYQQHDNSTWTRYHQHQLQCTGCSNKNAPVAHCSNRLLGHFYWNTLYEQQQTSLTGVSRLSDQPAEPNIHKYWVVIIITRWLSKTIVLLGVILWLISVCDEIVVKHPVTYRESVIHPPRACQHVTADDDATDNSDDDGSISGARTETTSRLCDWQHWHVFIRVTQADDW